MKNIKHLKTNLMKSIGDNGIILGLVSLFTDLSSQMVFPIVSDMCPYLLNTDFRQPFMFHQ